MLELASLATLEGRKLLRRLHYIARYERNYTSAGTLRLLWRIAVGNQSPKEFLPEDIHLKHSLGLLAGTRLWLEEIVSRYYYDAILSFVYAGAAILLVIVGLRRFSTAISDTVVLLSIGLEAFLLLVLFTVLLMSPPGEAPELPTEHISELLTELGEIGRETATATIQLQASITTLERLTNETLRLADAAERIAQHTAAAISPNPDLLPVLRSVNEALVDFKHCLEQLIQTTSSLKHELIEQIVRQELARLLAARTSDSSTSHHESR